MNPAQEQANRRRFVIVLGGIAAFVVVGVAYLAIRGEDEPSLADKTQSAKFACRNFVAEQVEPLDVDFRDLEDADVEYVGETFTVYDRAAVEGDLVNYECTSTRQSNGDWRLDDISLR